MALTDINSEDRLVQKTFARHLEKKLGWESVYAYKTEVFGKSHSSPLSPSPNGLIFTHRFLVHKGARPFSGCLAQQLQW